MKTLVIAPHPDDEILGVGGTLLRRKNEGFELGWIIVTSPILKNDWDKNKIQMRNIEINKVKKKLGFKNIYELNHPTTKLSEISFTEIVDSISKAIDDFKPQEIFLPHLGDVHTDHEIVHKAVISSTKTFRKPFIKKLIAYETLSETDFGLDKVFSPNLYIDISNFLEAKLNILKIYESELSDFPFPRSIEAVKSLAKVRGATSGFLAAEAFEILKSVE